MGDGPAATSGSLTEARRVGSYVGKYLTKATGETVLPGKHRYGVAQGYQPEVVRIVGDTAGHVLAQAADVMGGRPSDVWTSAEADDWRAAPAVWAAWS